MSVIRRVQSRRMKPENRHRSVVTLDGTRQGVMHGTLSGLPRGAAGIRETLNRMRELVRRYKKDLRIRHQALTIVDGLPPKAWGREARALQKWVQQNIRYVRDVRGVETVYSPARMLEIRQGDCDDQSVLLAAMLESIGHPTRFVAVGFSPFSFSHVYLESRIGHHWVPLETINPWPMGKKPDGVVKRMTVTN
jgi:transglutaminase-like putative cysteine protease